MNTTPAQPVLGGYQAPHPLKQTFFGHIEDLLSRINSRNKQFDIIRAFGILAILWGHNYQPSFVFFPVFYALPLFFFVSGYFFTPRLTIKDKFDFFVKKTRKQLIPYLLLNLLFGIITLWLKNNSVMLGQDITFQTMFIAPFGRGDQFFLFLAAWFLFNLYFINVFAGLVFQKSHMLNIVISIVAVVLMCIFLMYTYNKPNLTIWETFISRSVFGFAFFSMGYIFHIYESKIQSFIVKPINVVVLFIIFEVLRKNFGDVNYDILFGNVNNPVVIIPIIATLCIIFIIYIVAFHLTKILSPHSFVYLIGQHTFSIMVWHLACFLLINYILYKFTLIQFTDLSKPYFTYNIEKLWLVYQLPAIVLPLILIEVWYLIKTKTVTLLQNTIQISFTSKQTEETKNAQPQPPQVA